VSKPSSNQPILGIDLGTSNCCVALWIDGELNIIRNKQGENTTPSVLTSAPDGTVVVGTLARRQAVMNPKGTISEVKRLVGLRYDSPIVQSAKEILPYEITRAANGDAFVKMGERVLSPQEAQAYILEELAGAASEFLGTPVESAVITVPAFFDQTQRQAVRDAAVIAGLHTARILSEPTAAALAYGYAQLDNRRIAVVDLGGGTLDVAIMSVDKGHFEVLATDGDNQLGGADFDRTLARHFAKHIAETHDLDVTDDPVAMQRLLAESETVKRTLTQQNFAEVNLPYLAQKDTEVVNFDYRVTREEYEGLVADLVDRVTMPCKAALEQAGLRASQLDDVILIGGMTRSPLVQGPIGALFQRKPLQRINPDEAVATGAAILGAGISGSLDEVTFVDVAPRSVGIRASGDSYVTLIKKSSKLPASCRKAFSTTRDQQQSFELEILQGESEVASENRPLATVSVAPITQAPAGDVILELKVQMDEAGALVVHAKEKGSEDPTSVAIEPFSGLTPSNVKSLMEKHGNTVPSPAPTTAKPAAQQDPSGSAKLAEEEAPKATPSKDDPLDLFGNMPADSTPARVATPTPARAATPTPVRTTTSRPKQTPTPTPTSSAKVLGSTELFDESLMDGTDSETGKKKERTIGIRKPVQRLQPITEEVEKFVAPQILDDGPSWKLAAALVVAILAIGGGAYFFLFS
jgi:molecular chaperone DnaK